MKKTVLFAFGAVFPLVALAVLTIVMPPVGTWAIVMGLAVVAGVLSAQAGQELVQLLLSIREGARGSKQRSQSGAKRGKQKFSRNGSSVLSRSTDSETKTGAPRRWPSGKP